MALIEDLKDDFFEFVKKHLKSDVAQLMLSTRRDSLNFPVEFAVTQIKCRNSCRRKLTKFLENERFIFPDSISSEQASNQMVALYHAELIGKGKEVIDLSAGLGIDAMTIAAQGNHVTAIELDQLKCAALRHNSSLFEGTTVTAINGNSIDYLSNIRHHYDVAFIDPARRGNSNKRLYRLADCEPDVTANLKLIMRHCDTLMIKASPMLDILQLHRDLPSIEQFHLVSVDGECKEILIKLNSDVSEYIKPSIFIVEIHNSKKPDIRKYEWSDLGKTNLIADLKDIKENVYLYDPYAAIHKLNISNKLCTDYEGLKRISPNTDLYCSEVLYHDFPGRIFHIEEVVRKTESKQLKGKTLEVATRNYPLKSEELRKKLGIVTGGENEYLYAFRTGIKEKPLLVRCKRLNLD